MSKRVHTSSHMGLLKIKSCHTWIPSTNSLWIPDFQIVLFLWMLLKGFLEHPTYPLSPHSYISEHFGGEIGMAGFDVRSDDSCHVCFKGYRQEGSPMSCTKTPINEARGHPDQWEERVRRSGELWTRLPRSSNTSIRPSSLWHAPPLWSPSFKK